MSKIVWKNTRKNGRVAEGTCKYMSGEVTFYIQKSVTKTNYELVLGDSPNAMYTRPTMAEVKEYAEAFVN